MSVISLKNIEFYYPLSHSPALSNINLEVGEGEFLLVLGDSSSGKSTLTSIIGGIIPEFTGGELTGEVRSPINDIGYIMQDPQKQIVLDRVDSEIAYGLENMCIEPKDIKNIIYQTLSFLGIKDLKDKNTYELSGGQMQKVIIGEVLATGKQILILDEPTSFLDPVACDELFSILSKLNKDFGYTIILIEQNIEKALGLCDRVIYLEKGNVIFDDKSYVFIDDKRFYNSLPDINKLAKELKTEVSIRDLRAKIKDLKIEKDIKHYSDLDIPTINIKNLSFDYDKENILNSINLRVHKAEILSLIGENGGGKTTLLKNIAGILKPNSGEVSVYGKVGYLSDNPNDYLFNDTVYKELKFSNAEDSEIKKVAANLLIEDILKENPRDLSGGQRQKVAIATILVTNPDILLLDEPTKGLSSKDKKYLRDLLISLQNQGMTIVIISHDMSFVSQVSTRIATLFDGEICVIDRPGVILNSGIFYTTPISRVFKDIYNDIINFDDAKVYLKRN